MRELQTCTKPTCSIEVKYSTWHVECLGVLLQQQLGPFPARARGQSIVHYNFHNIYSVGTVLLVLEYTYCPYKYVQSVLKAL